MKFNDLRDSLWRLRRAFARPLQPIFGHPLLVHYANILRRNRWVWLTLAAVGLPLASLMLNSDVDDSAGYIADEANFGHEFADLTEVDLSPRTRDKLRQHADNVESHASSRAFVRKSSADRGPQLLPPGQRVATTAPADTIERRSALRAVEVQTAHFEGSPDRSHRGAWLTGQIEATHDEGATPSGFSFRRN